MNDFSLNLMKLYVTGMKSIGFYFNGWIMNENSTNSTKRIKEINNRNLIVTTVIVKLVNSQKLFE
jgi:hypothetical protein